jgi:UDP-N-acetylglucosamine 2-epimerase (non-hydrolysing)
VKKSIHLIAAARPNFMKIAPLYHAISAAGWAEPVVVHTGQHYDLNMSEAFFRDLMLPAPDFHLGVGSGSHAEQTGRVMIAYEKLLMEKRPDLVVVVGDVNSTVACTLAAVKLGVKTAHLEAGLRSFDRSMPEEINRLVSDAVADILWTPSPDGDQNLLREGISPEKIERVGNIMIDSLEMMRPRILAESATDRYRLSSGGYGVVTLHRPSNVDRPETLARLCEVLARIAAEPGMHLDEPLSYIPFMNLVFNCRLAITDSGGIPEETTYLGIPCLTLRPNTERPITVMAGTNRLCTPEDIGAQAAAALTRRIEVNPPPLWDGRTAGRVVDSAGRFLA